MSPLHLLAPLQGCAETLLQRVQVDRLAKTIQKGKGEAGRKAGRFSSRVIEDSFAKSSVD
jgi:hypothetical protein